MKTYYAKPGEVQREWLLVDATDMTPVSYTHLGIWEAKSPSWAGPTAGQLPAMIPMLSCN